MVRGAVSIDPQVPVIAAELGPLNEFPRLLGRFPSRLYFMIFGLHRASSNTACAFLRYLSGIVCDIQRFTIAWLRAFRSECFRDSAWLRTFCQCVISLISHGQCCLVNFRQEIRSRMELDRQENRLASLKRIRKINFDRWGLDPFDSIPFHSIRFHSCLVAATRTLVETNIYWWRPDSDHWESPVPINEVKTATLLSILLSQY
jgi:hypothetical protein